MTQLLSPKQVAKTIGVSESSLKRWCDQGVIRSEKTAGGHRRILVADVVQFLRETKRPVANAELLGLPAGVVRGRGAAAISSDLLAQKLQEGAEQQCRGIVIGEYLAGVSALEVCENLLTPAMHQLGDEWECGSVEVFQERRSCEIVSRLMHDLRNLMPHCPEEAPLAMGGSPSGDQYRLPGQMVEMVLLEAGWRVVTLGNNLPFSTMLSAIEQHWPRMFWLSISHVEDPLAMGSELTQFSAELPEEVHLALGGQALGQLSDAPMPGANVCASLKELKKLADSL